MPDVTYADVEFYKRNGAVAIRNLLTADEVDSLREAIDWNIANPGPLGATASRNTDPGRFFEDFCNWQRIPAYRDIIFESALPEIASRLMGSETVRLYHDQAIQEALSWPDHPLPSGHRLYLHRASAIPDVLGCAQRCNRGEWLPVVCAQALPERAAAARV